MNSHSLDISNAPFDDFIKERSFGIYNMERTLQRELTLDEKFGFTTELRLAFNMN